jgi:hypothetical protein
MTAREQKRFVRDLISNVQADLLANVERVPAVWDGIELRRWIADKFQESAYSHVLKSDRRRLREYKNDVLTRNL